MSTNAEPNTTVQAPATDATAQGATAPDFRVYRPPQSSDTSQNASRELPESFFTPTSADLKAAQASLSARVNALSSAPLRTQAMRDAEQKAKYARYPNVTIRVKFPDRTQLEKTFPSTDRIRSVYAFVRGSLREDVKPIKFVLFQTPPKRELKVSDANVRDQTLLQLQLAPSSVLHLTFEDDSLNHVNIPAPLDPVVLERAEDLPIPPDYTSEASSEQPSGSNTPRRVGASGSSGKTKVPRWLKLGPTKWYA